MGKTVERDLGKDYIFKGQEYPAGHNVEIPVEMADYIDAVQSSEDEITSTVGDAYPADFPDKERELLEMHEVPFGNLENMSKEELVALDDIGEKRADTIKAYFEE